MACCISPRSAITRGDCREGDRPVKATNFSGSKYFRGFSRQRLREKRPLAQRLIYI